MVPMWNIIQAFRVAFRDPCFFTHTLSFFFGHHLPVYPSPLHTVYTEVIGLQSQPAKCWIPVDKWFIISGHTTLHLAYKQHLSKGCELDGHSATLCKTQPSTKNPVRAKDKVWIQEMLGLYCLLLTLLFPLLPSSPTNTAPLLPSFFSVLWFKPCRYLESNLTTEL